MNARPADIGNALILGALWILAIVVVDPRGDVPLIDEWSYAESVRALVERGEIAFHPFTAPNLISQTLWGSLFGAVFGVNFTVLRASMLVMGLVGPLALYAWCRTIPVRPGIALVMAICLMFNAPHVALSFTFMTDVFFAATLLVSLLFITIGWRSGSKAAGATGWLFAVIALFCRQLAIAIPIGAAVGRLALPGSRIKATALGVAGIAAFMALQRAYEYWMAATGRTPFMFGYNSGQIGARLSDPWLTIAIEAGNSLAYLFFYLGLFALPASILLIRSEIAGFSARMRIVSWTFIAVLTVAASVGLVLIDQPMPFWFDIMAPWGIGNMLPGPPSAYGYRIGLTILAAFGGAIGTVLLTSRFFQHILTARTGQKAATRLLALTVALVLFAPMPVLVWRFDRYLIPILACVLVFVIARPRSAAALPRLRSADGIAALIVLAIFSLFSVLATRDFLATSRTRDAALSIALQQGVPRDRIDAGWVLNGRDLFGRVGNPANIESWHNDPVIVIGFRRLPDRETIAEVPVPRALPLAIAPLLVQRRRPETVDFIGPRTREQHSPEAN